MLREALSEEMTKRVADGYSTKFEEVSAIHPESFRGDLYYAGELG